jgi:hypothetical protein
MLHIYLYACYTCMYTCMYDIFYGWRICMHLFMYSRVYICKLMCSRNSSKHILQTLIVFCGIYVCQCIMCMCMYNYVCIVDTRSVLLNVHSPLYNACVCTCYIHIDIHTHTRHKLTNAHLNKATKSASCIHILFASCIHILFVLE